jgi:L-lactate dehydrogenase
MTLCTPTENIAGIEDVTVALPRLVGGTGVIETYHLPLSPEEETGLRYSAALIRDYIDQLHLS